MPARAVRFVCEAHGLDRKAVLDIGCSHGQHLVHFGPGSAGIDAVERNVEFCRALGFDVTLANVEDGLPDLGRRFEAIFASNLLEHLVAPHLFLLRLHALLAPNGRVFIHVPTMPPLPIVDRLLKRAIGHNGYLASEHINAFTPRTLAFTVERAGLRGGGRRLRRGARAAPARPRRAGLPRARDHGDGGGAPEPGFQYPEKRVEAFAPRFAAGALPTAGS